MPTANETLDKNKDKTLRNERARMTMEHGLIYRGKISSISITDGTCTVQIDTPSELLENCKWAVGSIFAPLLGYRIKQIPAPGTHVFVLYGNPSFVIQVAPADNPDGVSGNSATLTGEHARPESGVYGHGMSAFGPTNSDILEGEFEIGNSLGVSMLFLSNLMAMTASQRAKVEVHLANDMVRLVGERLDVHTGHSTRSEFNDGKLSGEEHAFSHSHESEMVAEDTSAADLRENEVDVNERRDHVDLYTDRYRKYTGWLGNFIHEFIKDPAFTIGQINSGNSSRYMGADGTILYRTLAEVCIEKVVRVQVPVRKKIPEDPEGNTEDDLKDGLDKSWDFSNPQHTAYQLREYARYLAGYKALSRFRGASKDFEVYPESEYLPPSPNNADPDAQETEYILRYSAIRIMRDGCILLTDGWGTTYYSGYGNIQLSSTNDIEISAGRNFVLTAKDAFVRTKNNLEVTQDEGGLVVNAKKFLKSLVREGSIWLKSDGNTNEDDIEGAGVFIDASSSNVIVHGKEGVGILSPDNEVVIESTELFMRVKDFMKVNATDIYLQARENLYTVVRNFFNRVTDRFQVNDSLSVSLRAMIVNTELDANRGFRALSYIKGPKRAGRRIEDLEPPKPHHGHIDLLRDDEEGRSIPPIPESDISGNEPFVSYRTNLQNTTFVLEEDGKTFTTNNYKPHAQYLVPEELGEIEWDLSDHGDWTGANRTDTSVKPWPGDSTKEFVVADEHGESLNKPSESEEWTQNAPEKQDMKRFLK